MSTSAFRKYRSYRSPKHVACHSDTRWQIMNDGETFTRIFTALHRETCDAAQGKDFSLSVKDAFQRSTAKYQSIEVDPSILAGVPHISGTRIPVYMVLEAIEE